MGKICFCVVFISQSQSQSCELILLQIDAEKSNCTCYQNFSAKCLNLRMQSVRNAKRSPLIVRSIVLMLHSHSAAFYLNLHFMENKNIKHGNEHVSAQTLRSHTKLSIDDNLMCGLTEEVSLLVTKPQWNESTKHILIWRPNARNLCWEYF